MSVARRITSMYGIWADRNVGCRESWFFFLPIADSPCDVGGAGDEQVMLVVDRHGISSVRKTGENQQGLTKPFSRL